MADMSWKIRGGYATDIGIYRAVNQDAITLRAIEKKGNWFVVGAVCDGIGGLERGEVSSGIVINGVNEWFDNIINRIDIETVDAEELFANVAFAAEKWNMQVREFCSANAIKSGTTMSLILIIRSQYYIVQVGDSRIYRYNQFLEQLTEDAVTEKIVNGKVKGFLNNFMGKADELFYTSLTGYIEENDVFIFCSDGFCHKLTENDVAYFRDSYKNGARIHDICITGIKQMEERQETDNISVGMIMVESSNS